MPDPVNTQSGRGMRRFIERETHFYLGQPYRLVSKQGPLPYVKLVDNTIQITLPTMPAPRLWRPGSRTRRDKIDRPARGRAW